MRVWLCVCLALIVLPVCGILALAEEAPAEEATSADSLGGDPEPADLDPDGAEVASPTDTLNVGTLHVDTLVLGDMELMSVPEQNTYPATGPLAYGLYIDAQTSQLGRVLIYVPYEYQRGSLTFDASKNLVNIRAATITGLMYRTSNNAQYNIRWTSFTTPEYRTFNSGTYAALTVTAIHNTNVIFVQQESDLPVVPSAELYQLVQIMLLGVIMLCLFMKRF